MSDYAYVAEKARKAFASVAKLESALARNPDDRVTELNLPSARRMAERARAEMDRLAALNRMEICDYRLVPVESSNYGLGHVSRSFLAFQNLFSQIYDAIKNGTRDDKRFDGKSERESMLDFAYTYSGSLGVALLARSERDFFSGSLDRPIDTIYEILNVADSSAVKDIAHALGRSVVKRMRDWAKANADGGFANDIQWKRSDGRLLREMASLKRFEDLVEIVESHDDKQEEPMSFRAVLVGADTTARTFHVVVRDGESYRGKLADDAEYDLLTIDKMYDVRMIQTRTYRYATDQTTVTNTVKELIGPLTGQLTDDPS